MKQKQYYFLFYFFTLTFLLTLATWAQNSDEITPPIIQLKIGQTHQLAADSQAQIVVTGKNAITITEQDDFIEILAHSPGTATVTVDKKSYRFNVDGLPTLQKKLVAPGPSILKNKIGLQSSIANGITTYTGECLRLTDYLDVVRFHEQRSSNFQFRARFDSDVQKELAAFVKNTFRSNALAAPMIQSSMGTNLIFPTTMKESEKNISTVAKYLGLPYQFEKSQLQVQKLIRVQIVIAEVSRRLQEDFGMDWPDSFQARIVPKLAGPKTLDLFMKSLVQRGFGRILAAPSLVAKSGGEAEFHAGGEIPFRIMTRSVHEIHWKRHGLFLKIKPVADSNNRLSIDLACEISLVDGSTNIEGLPGMKTNRVSSSFDLEAPRTIVLSGLTRQDSTTGTSGLHLLSEIPILGALFRSENYVNMKTELAVFVAPEIVNDAESAPLPTWNDQEVDL